MSNDRNSTSGLAATEGPVPSSPAGLRPSPERLWGLIETVLLIVLFGLLMAAGLQLCFGTPG